MRKSKHIIYTNSYNVESEIFTNGDDAIALQNALSLGTNDARNLASDIQGWQDDLGDCWQEWVVCCIMAQGLQAACEVSPARSSQINDDLYGPVDSAKAASSLAMIKAKAKKTNLAWWSPRLENAAKRAIKNDGSSSLVNGKHFSAYLQFRVRAYFGSAPLGISGFVQRAAHCYLMSLDFSAAWADGYRAQIRAVV